MSGTLLVSVIIKALNEERHIRACIESALAALANLPGEVILADSGSTDSTIAIASEYPIRIVQLSEPALRRCGIGPQLGFQVARGEYIYILDGDMELDPLFIERGLAALGAAPDLAGVAGLVEETSAENIQFRGRKERGAESRPGPCRWLDMGGLYRREAIESVGYFSNRNFHACEEQELGLRLSANGWRMRRLSWPGVRHHGHTEATFSLQRKRMRSGYLYGPGEMLRASLGKPWFTEVVRVHRHLLVTMALWLALVIGILCLPFTPLPLLAWGLALLVLFVNRVLRYRSMRDAGTVLLLWHIDALMMLRGFLRRGADPLEPIPARTLPSADPPSLHASMRRG
jgi:glycosyltransferase involved in cell wall biosynthesis